ncbi:MAG TPA: nucleoside monophosphate kinase [Candidatus Nitrosopolaris sp.]|nr:nucleoside monophosphate kinase [Candidatus Nitrosopolaris sp.]
MIILLGTPGSGKTTQTRMLADYLGCPWFSMGELIRRDITGQHRQDMLAGKIIDDKVTLDIVDKNLAKIDTSKECVFEGNPRSVPQARWWVQQEKAGRFKIKAVLHLVVDPSVAETRMLKRGRLDDHDENVIETRFKEYYRSIAPILEYLKEDGISIHEIDANSTVEEIAQKIHESLGV